MLSDRESAGEDRLAVSLNLTADGRESRGDPNRFRPIRTIDSQMAGGQDAALRKGHPEGHDVIDRLTILHTPIAGRLGSDHAVGAYAIRAEGLFERTTQVPVPR